MNYIRNSIKKNTMNNKILLSLFVLVLPLLQISSKEPKLKFLDKRVVDFKNINRGDTLKYTLAFTNIGDEDLVIKSVNKSCTCTSSSVDKDVIKKGEIGYLRINVSTDNQLGAIAVVVTLKTNANPSSSIVRLNMNVVDKFYDPPQKTAKV